MKFSKILASVTAAAAAVSMMAVNASAADWSKAGYADDNPDTVKIISTDENGATFTATSSQAQAKLRITLDQILENPEDVSKIKSGSWKITYKGLSVYTGTEIAWLGGGGWLATAGSPGHSLSPSGFAEDGTAIWDDEVTVEDTFKYLLPTEVPTDASDAEFVFMDWSGAADIFTNGITITISDLKLFDADGNEIPQKAYGGASDEAADSAPESDSVTDSATTGNTSAAAIAAVMALAGAAAVVSKKRS